MDRKKLLFIIAWLTANTAFGQKFMTRNADVSFYSDAPMEKIEGQNHKATSIIDAGTGQMEFAVLMKAFEFEKALLQDHFNENYVESDKFPKAIFKGNITNNNAVNYTKDGTYPVKVNGQMTLHGVTKDINADGTLTLKDGKLSAKSEFEITLADFNIQIPPLVKDKISKDVKITVDASYEPFKSKSTE